MTDTRRRLSAIMSADVASYSRLMGEDERATVATLNAYREIFKNHISAHDGRVVDTAGDSVLAVFDSVVEAVESAAEIQVEIEGRNAELEDDRRMRFRIGVNLGDVIEQIDGTIYGDGVNIAARLEGLAAPGGVTLSGAAHDFVDGKVKFEITYIGEHEVKNINRPVRVYQMATGSDRGVRVSQTVESTLPDKPSIAVLPFVNMSSNADEGYFADGIAEDIMTELSRFQELVVTARTSVSAYKGKAINAQEAGRELNVRYLLEGSVRKGGDRVRVTAQLIEVAGGHHLWAERYDRKLEDVFAVQDELTGKIVASLVGSLVDSERRRVRTGERTSNPKAYDLVLKGREHWFRMTKEDNCKALEYYHQAIELDPEYSRAYASIGWAYALSYGEYWADDPQEALDKALEYARKSVEIDRSSHSNHIALGQVYYFRKSLRRAIEAFEQAISLNPNDPDGYVFLSSALSLNGQADKALELLEHAFELNSDLPQWHRGIYVIAYFNLRRYDEAIAAIEKLNNPYISYYRWMAATFAHGGRLDWAKAKAKTYLEAYPDFDLEDHLQRMPFSHEEDREHYAEGLRKAGLVGRN